MTYQHYFTSKLDERVKDLLTNKNINPLDIEDIFTDTNLSKAELKEKYTYLALQLPEYDRDTNFFQKKQIQLVYGKDYIIIIDENNYKNLQIFEHQRKQTNLSFNTPSELALEILDFLITRLIRVVNKLRDEIVDIEKSIFNFESSRDLILDIQILKKNIINFSSLMLPIEELLTDLQKTANKEESLKIEDTSDKISKMLNNLNNFKEQTSLLTETNEVLIARSTNEIVKVMTFVNILFLIPTIIVGFFGMNIGFGWNTDNFNPFIFFGIIGLMVTSMITAFVIFKKKKWL
ncbi:MAG: magnesium transporter CorA family protein [Patescibacteria group bacterium]